MGPIVLVTFKGITFLLGKILQTQCECYNDLHMVWHMVLNRGKHYALPSTGESALILDSIFSLLKCDTLVSIYAPIFSKNCSFSLIILVLSYCKLNQLNFDLSSNNSSVKVFTKICILYSCVLYINTKNSVVY